MIRSPVEGLSHKNLVVSAHGKEFLNDLIGDQSGAAQNVAGLDPQAGAVVHCCGVVTGTATQTLDSAVKSQLLLDRCVDCIGTIPNDSLAGSGCQEFLASQVISSGRAFGEERDTLNAYLKQISSSEHPIRTGRIAYPVYVIDDDYRTSHIGIIAKILRHGNSPSKSKLCILERMVTVSYSARKWTP